MQSDSKVEVREETNLILKFGSLKAKIFKNVYNLHLYGYGTQSGTLSI